MSQPCPRHGVSDRVPVSPSLKGDTDTDTVYTDALHTTTTGHGHMSLFLAVPDELVERIAQRAAEMVLDTLRTTAPDELVDAASVAAALGCSRDWVYEHADELGGRRIGDGARPRLRFDLHTALAAWQPSSTESPARATPRRRRSSNGHTNLLPVVE